MLVGIAIKRIRQDALIPARDRLTRIMEELRWLLSNRGRHLVSAVMYIVTENAERSEPMPETISRLL